MKASLGFTASIMVIALLLHAAGPDSAMAALLMLRQGVNFQVSGRPAETRGWLAKGTIVEIPDRKVRSRPKYDRAGKKVGDEPDVELTLKLWLQEPIYLPTNDQLYYPVKIKRLGVGSTVHLGQAPEGLVALAALNRTGTQEMPSVQFVTSVDTPFIEPPPPGMLSRIGSNISWAFGRAVSSVTSIWSTPAQALPTPASLKKERVALSHLRSEELPSEVRPGFNLMTSKMAKRGDPPQVFQLDKSCGISTQSFNNALTTESRKIGIPIHLMQGMAFVESGGQCAAVGRTGGVSRGLFQMLVAGADAPACSATQLSIIERTHSAAALRPAVSGKTNYRPHCLENPILNMDMALGRLNQMWTYFKDAGNEDLDKNPELKWRLVIASFNGGQEYPIDARGIARKVNAAQGRVLYNPDYWPDLVALLFRRAIPSQAYDAILGDVEKGRHPRWAALNVGHVEEVFQAGVAMGLDVGELDAAQNGRTNAPLPDTRFHVLGKDAPRKEKTLEAVRAAVKALGDTGPAK